LDNDIKKSGEYQLTDALSAMLEKGMVFRPATIEKWMDFGNKNAAVQTNREILQWEYEHGGTLRGENIELENVKITEPCYIGNNVILRNSEIGPYVSIGDGTSIEHAQAANSLIGSGTEIVNAKFSNSMLGNFVKIDGKNGNLPPLDLGDYSKIGY
jgi:glucose-1-phosphate thymidylyltransferase